MFEDDAQWYSMTMRSEDMLGLQGACRSFLQALRWLADHFVQAGERMNIHRRIERSSATNATKTRASLGGTITKKRKIKIVP